MPVRGIYHNKFKITKKYDPRTIGRMDRQAYDDLNDFVTRSITEMRNLTGPFLRTGNLSALSADVGLLTAGIIRSQNWGQNSGMEIDLTKGTITVGGSATPTFSHNSTTGATEIAGHIVIITGEGIDNLSDAGDLATANDLDGVPDGSTYFRTDGNEITGAGRAYTAINSSNNLITSILAGATVGTPAQTGLYLGSDYMGFYDTAAGGAWKTFMDSSGNFYLGGTSGSLVWLSATTALTVDGTINARAGLLESLDIDGALTMGLGGSIVIGTDVLIDINGIDMDAPTSATPAVEASVTWNGGSGNEYVFMGAHFDGGNLHFATSVVDDGGDPTWRVDVGDGSNASFLIIRDDEIVVGSSASKLTFYAGGTAVALQTGVAVSAAGIHAALVNLNLITA